MPRSQESPVGRLLKAIRGMDLEIAKVAVGLINDELHERLQRSADARARAVKVAKVVVAMKHVGPSTAKTSHKKKPAKATKKTKPAPVVDIEAQGR